MPFKPPPVQPDFSSLFTSLTNSRLQVKDYALYQTIFFLIQNIERSRDLILKQIQELDDTTDDIVAATFLTVESETALFPNSRQLLAGTGITFNDSIDGQRIINATSGSGASMVPMATGAEPLEIMSNGAGEVLLIAFDTSQPV